MGSQRWGPGSAAAPGNLIEMHILAAPPPIPSPNHLNQNLSGVGRGLCLSSSAGDSDARSNLKITVTEPYETSGCGVSLVGWTSFFFLKNRTMKAENTRVYYGSLIRISMGLIRLLFQWRGCVSVWGFGPKRSKAIVLEPECTTDSPGLKTVDF